MVAVGVYVFIFTFDAFHEAPIQGFLALPFGGVELILVGHETTA